MGELPEVRYVADGDGRHLAFQQFGDGPPLLLLAGWATNLDGMWREPSLSLFLRRLGSMRSVVMFDKRGVGLSDPAPDVHNAQDAVDDVLTVLDECGWVSVQVLAAAEASFVAVPLAAFHPERVRGMVLVNATARTLAAAGYPEGVQLDTAVRYSNEAGPSTARTGLGVTAPSRRDDPAFSRWAAEYQRSIASPAVSRRIMRMMGDADVRGLLAAVQCPTVVLHRAENRFYSIGAGRVLAGGIAGAEFVELEGADHLFWIGDTEPIFAAVERASGIEEAPVRGARRLATVLFVDVVRSTERVVAAGDDRWRELVDTVEHAMDRAVAEQGGWLVKFTGDGALAIFDTPLSAVRAAARMRSEAHSVGLGLRSGIHCGEIDQRGNDVSGIAVVIASRVAGLAADGQIWATALVGELCFGARLAVEPVGERLLKGVDRPVALIAIEPRDQSIRS
jgi:class 3 adenylate cyclase